MQRLTCSAVRSCGPWANPRSRVPACSYTAACTCDALGLGSIIPIQCVSLSLPSRLRGATELRPQLTLGTFKFLLSAQRRRGDLSDECPLSGDNRQPRAYVCKRPTAVISQHRIVHCGQATPSARGIPGHGPETVVDFIHKASLAKSGRCAMLVHVHANRETVR